MGPRLGACAAGAAAGILDGRNECCGEDMSEQRLRELLHALHDELGRGARVDPGIESDLRSIMDDIRDALDRSEPAAHEGLRQRLTLTLDHFEADHPRLALNVRRMIDVMGRLST
jgi:hypothetical protein